jgi:hypothetical protein
MARGIQVLYNVSLSWQLSRSDGSYPPEPPSLWNHNPSSIVKDIVNFSVHDLE